MRKLDPIGAHQVHQTDTRQLQNLRGLHCICTQDDLAIGMHAMDPVLLQITDARYLISASHPPMSAAICRGRAIKNLKVAKVWRDVIAPHSVAHKSGQSSKPYRCP